MTASLRLCVLAALALAVAGEGPNHDTLRSRQYAACRADDARCLALQRDVCDPWNVTAADK